ncbi:MAG: RNA-guided endonuclease InsQ/TnpB family protein [Phycisphaerae bacterium]
MEKGADNSTTPAGPFSGAIVAKTTGTTRPNSQRTGAPVSPVGAQAKESGKKESKVRITKVAKFRILKPVNMSWDELGQLLRDARYRAFRLANLVVSEAYLSYHMSRSGKGDQHKPEPPGKLSRRLREMLEEELTKKGQPDVKLPMDRFSKTGALPDTVVGALTQYKIRPLTKSNKWKQVIRGQVSLPTFRLDMAVPVRCDKPYQRRLEQAENGDVCVDLMICAKPYPRVVLQTGDIGDSLRAILTRLLANKEQSLEAYRQRTFEIKQDKLDGKWHLFITYSFPAPKRPKPNPQTVVGVDLGFSVPLYVAVNNGYARLGWRHFAGVSHRIKSLQNEVDRRRRQIQRAGRADLAADTAGAGHGRRRKLQPIEKLQGRIERSYTTLNHQLSASVVRFAMDNGAGVIQMEDLKGLQDTLRGTFIGARWRYHQLQQFVEYKAREAGIEVRLVNPRYTSRRCSKCGYINMGFSRAHRDAEAHGGFKARFVCARDGCKYEADPDYNAARNIATIDIAALVEAQCRSQGISLDETINNSDEAVNHVTLAQGQSRT